MGVVEYVGQITQKLTSTQLHLFDETACVAAIQSAEREESDSSYANVPVMPPATPWTALEVDTPAIGYLSVYLSEDLSKLPIRAIAKPYDNKSDPNIETGTYGLFSTCERGMRAGIVKNEVDPKIRTGG